MTVTLKMIVFEITKSFKLFVLALGQLVLRTFVGLRVCMRVLGFDYG